MNINQHYHCKVCGTVLKEIGRIEWTPLYGIRIIYSCGLHLFVWRETFFIRGMSAFKRII